MIRLIERKDIEDKKWNGCVHFAENDFPYGYTWALDNVTEQWHGLVWDNYEMVFPIVHRKKFGFEYLYQPLFTQQLGVFASRKVETSVLQSFLEAIPRQYQFIEINLNYLNDAESLKYYEVSERTNLILPLNKIYEEITAGYSDNLKRNLKKASQAKLSIRTDFKIETLVDFYFEHAGKKIKGLQAQHRHVLHRLIYNAVHYGMGRTFGVFDAQEQLLAVNFFLSSKTRMVNLLPASNESGRQQHAMPFLLDYMIQSFAGTEKKLDFEGSQIDGVARFYKSFGATEQNYWHVKRNTLPWYARLLKR